MTTLAARVAAGASIVALLALLLLHVLRPELEPASHMISGKPGSRTFIWIATEHAPPKCPPQTVAYDGKCLLPVATPRPVPASVDGGEAR